MSAVGDIRQKWAAKLAGAAAELVADTLVVEHGVAAVVVIIGTTGEWAYSYRARDGVVDAEAARVVRRVSEGLERDRD